MSDDILKVVNSPYRANNIKHVKGKLSSSINKALFTACNSIDVATKEFDDTMEILCEEEKLEAHISWSLTDLLLKYVEQQTDRSRKIKKYDKPESG